MAIVINGSGTVTGLAVGGLPDGTVDSGTLATDSVTAAKLEVSAITHSDLPAGSVLQVVNATTSTLVTVSSATHVDTGLTGAITPKFSSSKILVEVHQNGVQTQGNHHNNDVTILLYRGSSLIAKPAAFVGFTASNTQQYASTVSVSYLDSPSTTSATTYKTTFANPDGGGSGGTVVVQSGTPTSTLTLTEIAG